MSDPVFREAADFLRGSPRSGDPPGADGGDGRVDGHRLATCGQADDLRPLTVGEPPPSATGQAGSLRAVPIGEFAVVDEASAEPLLGDEDNTVLAAGGSMVMWGKGGAGKTTLAVDLAFHLAAGVPWLGLPVPRRCRVLVIENEGPRGKLRKKLRAKLGAWSGLSLDEHLLVLEEPWGRFSFAGDAHRDELASFVREHEIDVIVAGPVGRLGIAGSGTPDEVAEFVGRIEEVRARVERPLATVLVHHENKAGTVSGAWEGVPDTLVHVRASGNGATRVEWDKVRWGSALHGTAWKLLWRPGESFEREETPEVTDDDLRASILAAVEKKPGCSWRAAEAAIKGTNECKRAVRDALIDEGALVNRGGGRGGARGGGMRLYLPQDAPPEGPCADDPAHGPAHDAPLTGAAEEGTVRRAPTRKGGARAHGSRGAPGPPPAGVDGAGTFTLFDASDLGPAANDGGPPGPRYGSGDEPS